MPSATLPLDSAGAFSRRDTDLFCEDVPLARIAAEVGTPVYVYSRTAIVSQFKSYQTALKEREHQICYAMKANSSLAILDLLARLGAGFDTVSEGEIRRAIHAGAQPHKIVFSGVGKTRDEIAYALKIGIGCFNVESIPELSRIAEIAASLGCKAPVSVRCNPNVDAKTHPYISTGLKNNKFGVAYDEIVALYEHAAKLPSIRIVGIDSHIGSQITTIAPYLDACDRILDIVDELHRRGIELEHIDFGGGLGIEYEPQETVPAPEVLVKALLDKLDTRGYGHKKVIFEPGRSIVGAAGAMLTEVQYIKAGKEKNFCIVDAAMNDMIRPALYGAWMSIEPVTQKTTPAMTFDIVGPVCESSDWLGKDRTLALCEGDLLALLGAGAYGFAMSSQYNSRRLAAEVMVEGSNYTVIRPRQNYETFWQDEVRLSIEHN